MRDDMTPPQTDPAQTPHLRFLRILVTVLSVTMIAGMVLVISLLVSRLQSKPPLLPEEITLPSDIKAKAVTMAENWVLVLGGDNQLYMFDRLTGSLMQTIALNQP